MSEKYIFTMHRVNKTFPPSKQVLRDISLSFFHGAKIGVLGLNGSGKSTLLKIMAGIEKEFSGEARAAEGTSVGYLPQEPVLDDTKTVRDNVLLGLGPIVGLLNEFEDISAKMGDPDLDWLVGRVRTLTAAAPAS